MQSIKNLIQGLKIEDRYREFDAFKILDDNIKALEDRIVGLEKKNLRYFCRAYRDAAVEIPTGVPTVVSLNATEYPQFGNLHDNTNDPDKIFIRRSGVYHVSGEVQWEAVGGGTFRQASIRVDRSGTLLTIVAQRAVAPAGATIVTTSCACSYYLYNGDFVQLIASHDAGLGIDVAFNHPQSPFLCVSERMEDLDPPEYGLLDPNANTR